MPVKKKLEKQTKKKFKISHATHSKIGFYYLSTSVKVAHFSMGTAWGPEMEYRYRKVRKLLKESKNGQWESKQMLLLL